VAHPSCRTRSSHSVQHLAWLGAPQSPARVNRDSGLRGSAYPIHGRRTPPTVRARKGASRPRRQSVGHSVCHKRSAPALRCADRCDGWTNAVCAPQVEACIARAAQTRGAGCSCAAARRAYRVTHTAYLEQIADAIHWHQHHCLKPLTAATSRRDLRRSERTLRNRRRGCAADAAKLR
jgi:hypothetical protein